MSVTAKEKIREKITKLALFQDLKPKALQALLDEYKADACEQGKIFVNQGDRAACLFVLVDGLAQAYRAESSGEVKELAMMRADDWFGEISVLCQQPALATVKAMTPCTYLIIEPILFKVL